MPKTYKDYLNDPRIKNESMGLREVHAMRFKIQDETDGMTSEELSAYYHEGAAAAFAAAGISPEYTK